MITATKGVPSLPHHLYTTSSPSPPSVARLVVTPQRLASVFALSSYCLFLYYSPPHEFAVAGVPLVSTHSHRDPCIAPFILISPPSGYTMLVAISSISSAPLSPRHPNLYTAKSMPLKLRASKDTCFAQELGARSRAYAVAAAEPWMVALSLFRCPAACGSTKVPSAKESLPRSPTWKSYRAPAPA